MRLNGDNTELSLGKELPTTFEHFHESVYLIFIAIARHHYCCCFTYKEAQRY